MSDPKDPRFRSYRRISVGLYLLFSVGFSCLVIYSVFRSVFEMTPPRPGGGPDIYSPAQCAQGAQALFGELEAQRHGLSQPPAAAADRRFLDFRVDFLVRLNRLRAGCGVGRPEARRVRRALDLLEKLVDHYTTTSVQFTHGPARLVDELRASLEELERAP